MRGYIFVLITVLFSFKVQAYSNFIENPYTPYPPGCATLPDLQTTLYGDNVVKISEQEIPLSQSESAGTKKVNAILAVYRVACAEPNRSVILLEFRIPANQGYTYYETPQVIAALGGDYNIGMNLAREPNSWGVGIEPGSYSQTFGGPTDWEDVHARSWIFVLENQTPIYPWFDLASTLSASQYNGSFDLVLKSAGVANTVIAVPATASVLTPNTRIPLSGRLSGNWVVEGASDQGFVIAVSEVVQDSVPENYDLVDSPLLMFLSWYTYDANGNVLWLTGASQFEMGDTQVTIPIEYVTNGQFLGSKTAKREVVGSVTLTGKNCDDLQFQYDLSGFGLGSGTRRLQRLYSLETASLVCRDYEARILAK